MITILANNSQCANLPAWAKGPSGQGQGPGGLANWPIGCYWPVVAIIGYCKNLKNPDLLLRRSTPRRSTLKGKG